MALPAHFDLSPAWCDIRAELRRLVGESTYELWLAPLEARAWEDGVLVLQAPATTQAWVSKRFGRVLGDSVRSVIGPDAKIAFAGPGEGAGEENRGTAPGTGVLDIHSRQELNPRYSFDQFIIGDGNRLAHAAALAVAELPGQAYNPLFLHAPPGLGKTHLLHAIGNYVAAFGGGSTVRYTTVEAFTNHFISAIGSRSLEPFKHRYRDADVLLIDDVQFLASKARTEEEFFHTFNALYETGRQLVLTCDRLPRRLVGIEDRLRERFESGLVAEIKPPDHATRVAILRKRVALDRITVIDDPVLDLIAELIPDNIRSLEGALIRIVAHHSLTGTPLDTELTRSVLGHGTATAPSTSPTISSIQRAVATHFGMSVGELTSATRTARTAWARQLAIHLSRELTNTSLPATGRAFGNRSHATVLHACKRVAERTATDPKAEAELAQLRSQLSPNDADRFT
ncbi:MAG: chromosomal replication initiator protein DnaA [Solirubrobacteraceae bacterium]